MNLKFERVVAKALVAVALCAASAAAQTPPPSTASSAPVPSTAPAPSPGSPDGQPAVPPAGSGPVYRTLELAFHPLNESIIEAQTYLYYIQAQPSRGSAGVWIPFTEQTEQTLLEDFRRLWATNFLDNLWIEVKDDTPYPNGVASKRVIINMEERPRVK